MSTQNMSTCKDCGKQVEEMEVFPGPLCLACHARKFDAEVARTGRLPRPDFIKAVKIGGAR
jgi:anaerobic ribonucleoside-triphosphate reductase